MSIKTSEQIETISEALAKAQGKFGAAIKNSRNPAFSSKYADLSAVIDATLEHLNNEGITCMQHPALTWTGEGESREAMITVTTRLLHKSGQWIESDLSIPAVQRDRFDAQSCGSALTYACRYALQSICVVPREDDDGNMAAGRGSKEAAGEVAKRKVAEFQKEQGIRAESLPEMLFYTLPPTHNGNKAEFINIYQYMAAHKEDEDGLKAAFTRHKAKKTASGTALVPAEELDGLLQLVNGELGIDIQQLKAPQ